MKISTLTPGSRVGSLLFKLVMIIGRGLRGKKPCMMNSSSKMDCFLARMDCAKNGGILEALTWTQGVKML